MAPLGIQRPGGIKNDCFTPRSYQVELLDKAVKKNIIVQLGTGAGKTFIAVLLIKEYALQLRPSIKAGGRRAFFIVDKVALVDQQAAHIECHTSLVVGKTHGNLNPEIWQSKEAFDRFLDAHHVVVLTAQILLDLIQHAFLSIQTIALIIVDECHHALGSRHPFRVIMQRYMDCPIDERPRVLGLTASLINDKTEPAKLEQQLIKLEKFLDSSIETSCDLVSVSKYGAKPTVAVLECRNFEWDNDLTATSLKYLDFVRDFCKNTQEFHADLDVDIRKFLLDVMSKTQSVLKQLGPWAVLRVVNYQEKEIRKQLQSPILGQKQLDFLRMGDTALRSIRRLLEPKMKVVNSMESLSDTVPHRITRLLNILEAYSPEKQENRGVSDTLCGIIFVDQRMVAYTMKIILKTVAKWDPSRFGFLKVDYVVGNSGSSLESDNSQACNKRQEEVLKKFRKGELNVLIATNVLEEGVDVRHCNLVVKFDRPINYRSFVQSKGRARKQGARYFVLVEEGDAQQSARDLHAFDTIEKMLLSRCRSVHNPPEHENIESVDDLFPPFRVESTGAQVSLSGAIQLINRYCGKLPSDMFTLLVPHSRLISIPSGDGRLFYKAELLLPMNSPLKEAITMDEPVPSKKLAQMIVALKACQRLYEMKELNDHLLPVGKEAAVALELDEDPDEWSPALSAKVGSVKRKQLYDKRVARALHESLPRAGEECLVYVLELDLINPLSAEENPRNRRIVNPKETDFCFGFLSSKPMPKVPPFPAYLRQGESRVSVVLAPALLSLDEDTLSSLKHFHHYIFHHVLQLYKDCLDFRLDEFTPTTTLIIPLNRTRLQSGQLHYSLNMEYVTEVVANMEDMPRVPSIQKRKHFKFDRSVYKDAVVMPWYRNLDQPIYFYVAEVLEHMTPSSPFPDDDYSSFNDYFMNKYNLEIFDQQQNLLEVEYTSNRLNLLLPRSRGRARSTKTATSTTTSSQRQIFVAELLDRHPISAHLWHSIAALPSFFYRMNSLLLADELRERVLVDALGMEKEKAKMQIDFHWKPLAYPSSHEEKNAMIVSKLKQLNEEHAEMEAAKEKAGEGGEEETKTFHVGVWDPEMAAGLVESGREKAEGFMEEEAGLAGPEPGGGGDLSDEDDEEHALFFDFSKYVKDTSKFAAPRDDIVECGWGDAVLTVPASSGWGELAKAEPVVDTPFLLLAGAGGQININGLLADLVGQILPGSVTPAKTTSQGSTSLFSASKTRGAEDDKVDEYEKETKGKGEEIINLISFDDEPEMVVDKEEVEGDEDESEMRRLERGERLKLKRDHAVEMPSHMLQGEVLAPAVKQSRFSFHSPSPAFSETEDPLSCGVSPCLLLTALTTSNANDGINLERLETIGDSFLKFAVTDFLFHTHEEMHEGKLSFARSKEVSNCNLYRLGKRAGIPNLLVASKFDVQDAWLPPCYVPTTHFKAPNNEEAEEKDKLMESVLEGHDMEPKEIRKATGWDEADEDEGLRTLHNGIETIIFPKQPDGLEELSPLPYNMLTQQYISDKSIADAVEAVIGAHLLSLGPTATLKMMKWLGLKVLTGGVSSKKPLLRYVDTPQEPERAQQMLSDFWVKFDFSSLEDRIGYRFMDKAFLLQAFTHASYYPNRITSCYQRLEFLGDAVLDYVITRFLFEHERQYSPGVLTDLRSALVNNTIFASLAIKYDFHKHFVAMCPGLHFMIEKFVKLCNERNFFGANFHSEMYMVTTEDEMDEGQEEDVEVPKAMGDIFESVAGAIYLDSGRDLDVVWRVFYHLMRDSIEECCRNPPRSPVRELLEREHDRAKFSKMERIMELGKVRVTVEVGAGQTKMRFTGMGRNYRIAKTTAAKRALRYLKGMDEDKRRSERRAAPPSTV